MDNLMRQLNEIISFAYDANGYRTNMVDSCGTTRQTFDAMNSLFQVAMPSAKPSATTTIWRIGEHNSPIPMEKRICGPGRAD
jgi:hypothetical protein